MRNNSRALMMAALAAGLLGAPAVGGNVEIVRHGSNGSGPTIGPPRRQGQAPAARSDHRQQGRASIREALRIAAASVRSAMPQIGTDGMKRSLHERVENVLILATLRNRPVTLTAAIEAVRKAMRAEAK
jgi:hypothetical protein